MDKVEVQELTKYGWECPNCGGWNELDDDPGYSESVVCDECGAEFEPEVQ